MAETPLSPEEIKKANELAAQLGKTFDVTKQSATIVRDLIASWEKQLDNTNSTLEGTYDYFRNITDQLKKSNSAVNDIKKGYSGLTSISQTILQFQQGYRDLSMKDVSSLKEKLILNKGLIEQANQTLEREKTSASQQKISLIDNIAKQRNISSRQVEAAFLANQSIEIEKSALDEIKNKTNEINKQLNLKQFRNKLSNDEIKALIDEKQKLKDQADIRTSNINGLKQQAVLSKDEITDLTNIYNLLNKNNIEQQQLAEKVKITEEALNDTEKILKRQNQLLGLSGNLIGGASKLMDKLGLSGLKTYLNFDKAKEAMDETALAIAKGEKSGGKLTVLFSGLKSLIGGLGAAISSAFSPISIITLVVTGLVKAFNFLKETLFGIDQQSADFGKNMGISYTNSLKVTEQLSIAANKAGGMYVSTKGMIQSLETLNNAFGTNLMFSDQTVTEFSKLRDEIGLSNEQLMSLFKTNLLNNNSLEDSVAQVSAGTLQFNNQNKTALSTKTILDGIAKSSAAARLNFRGSVPELVKAVASAKALGLELDELNKIGRGLLNFEESISAELEAELLTGRQINLDKARYYALTNNSAGLARELRAQIGSAAQFGRMNVLQQESFAKALGMSKEQLAEILETTELLGGKYASMDDAQKEYNALRDKGLTHEQIVAKMGKEELVNKLKSKSVQEEFNATMEKLKELLGNIFRGPLSDILKGLSEWFNATDDKGVKNTEKLKQAFEALFIPLKEIAKSAKEWLTEEDLETGKTGFDKIKDTLSAVWNVFKQISTAVYDFFTEVDENGVTGFERFKSTFMSIWNVVILIKDVIVTIVQNTLGFWITYLNQISKAFGGIFGSVEGGVGSFDAIKKILSVVGKILFAIGEATAT